MKLRKASVIISRVPSTIPAWVNASGRVKAPTPITRLKM